LRTAKNDVPYNLIYVGDNFNYVRHKFWQKGLPIFQGHCSSFRAEDAHEDVPDFISFHRWSINGKGCSAMGIQIPKGHPTTVPKSIP
jgi:hypothetical protein